MSEREIKKVDWVFFRRFLGYISAIIMSVAITWFFLMGGIGAFIIDADGFVRHDIIDVTALYEGRVKEIYVKPGDYIHKGEEIAKLDSIEILKEIIIAMAEAKNNRDSFNSSAKIEYMNRFRKLQELFNEGRIISPEDGWVATEIVHVGQVIHIGDPIVKLYKENSYVIAHVSDSYLFDVKEGEKVLIKAKSKKIKGTIVKIYPISESLPKQLQHPHTTEKRGTVIKVVFNENDMFDINQHVTISSCGWVDGC